MLKENWCHCYTSGVSNCSSNFAAIGLVNGSPLRCSHLPADSQGLQLGNSGAETNIPLAFLQTFSLGG